MWKAQTSSFLENGDLIIEVLYFNGDQTVIGRYHLDREHDESWLKDSIKQKLIELDQNSQRLLFFEKKEFDSNENSFKEIQGESKFEKIKKEIRK